jgi:hypothetical protein
MLLREIIAVYFENYTKRFKLKWMNKISRIFMLSQVVTCV